MKRVQRRKNVCQKSEICIEYKKQSKVQGRGLTCLIATPISNTTKLK